MKEGFILKCHAGNYFVYSEGKEYMCRARGKLRIEGTSPLAGDKVLFDEKENYVLSILKRDNFFVRPPIANVDQVIIVASLFHPDISLGLINRFMTMVISRGVKPILAISKIDLLEETDPRLELVKNSYKGLDYKVIYFSSKTNKGIEEIKELLKNKKTVITGQSGVGKSSLINLLLPDKKQETNEISEALGRGKHVTRVSEFIPYDSGWIADTPGFSLIELDLSPSELASSYPGFENLFNKCKFNDCKHDSEKNCAVKEAINNGLISKDHYEIYLSLLHELQNKKERF